MNTKIQIIETSELKDIEEIEKIEQDLFKLTGGLSRGILVPLSNFLGFILIAKNKQKIVGHTAFFHTKNREEMYCASLAVLRKFRKQGIAKNLIKKAEEKCKSMGIKTLIATGSPENFGSCKVFLNNREWRVVNLYKNFYRRGINSFLFKKDLEENYTYSDTINLRLKSIDKIILKLDNGYFGTKIINDNFLQMKKL